MSINEFYNKIKTNVESREVIELYESKGSRKVQNRFITYGELSELCETEIRYEVKKRISILERQGKIEWSFRHKKYIVK